MAKNDLIKLRVTTAEKQSFQDAADIAGIPLSAWARERLRRITIRELEDAGKTIAFLQRESSKK